MYQEVFVRRASDVVAATIRGSGSWHDILPRGSRPLFAVLRFHVTGTGKPYLAEIWPPHILTLHPAYAAEVMKGWLAARGFIRTP